MLLLSPGPFEPRDLLREVRELCRQRLPLPVLLILRQEPDRGYQPFHEPDGGTRVPGSLPRQDQQHEGADRGEEGEHLPDSQVGPEMRRHYCFLRNTSTYMLRVAALSKWSLSVRYAIRRRFTSRSS